MCFFFSGSKVEPENSSTNCQGTVKQLFLIFFRNHACSLRVMQKRKPSPRHHSQALDHFQVWEYQLGLHSPYHDVSNLQHLLRFHHCFLPHQPQFQTLQNSIGSLSLRLSHPCPAQAHRPSWSSSLRSWLVTFLPRLKAHRQCELDPSSSAITGKHWTCSNSWMLATRPRLLWHSWTELPQPLIARSRKMSTTCAHHVAPTFAGLE